MRLLKCEKGVTLVEIVAVLLISSIILSIGTVSLIPVEKIRLDRTVKSLQNEIRHIQRMSLYNNAEYRLFFDVDTRDSYSILKREGGLNHFISKTYFPKGVTLITNAEKGEVSFTPKGTIDRASTVILNSNKYSVAITLAVGTGNVSIKEIRPISNMYKLSDFP